ncbi:TPA: response regulator [Bacillus anthracis]|uniref:Two-component system response regulator DcuR n=1 Tax=Bacillus thuringiensis serovar vazensis TaxID=180867 RepID=A0A243CT30_BACTU|nr:MULTISPECIES: response regulator [Bacillus cereus group]MCU5688096.1 response regulator [Bacillus cereus]HDR4492216.1 response regulator [Bacillus cereus biovar anthracis]ADK03301.1 response regulator [Bacillus cereus biovar anthracis str. CI]MEB9907815.1 response regulator [Bacillus anthracis]MEC1955461.1 response regulator [Bacillus anthracis]
MIKVLIVEDDPMVAMLNTHYLEQVGGFELVQAVNSVKSAIEVLEESRIDLVLLDIFMPEETGFELLMYIRNQEKEIDIMMISAVHDMGSIKKALQYGVVDYLIKPFTFERFKEALTIYREKLTFMKEQQKISQSELDSLILQKEKREPTVTKELPKGLTKQTLQLIWQKIKSLNGRAFTTDEMSQLVGISRVSIRKYVMFLTDIGVLENEMMYQHVGRPVSKLRCVDQKKIEFYV